MSPEESLARLGDRVREHGWTYQGVTGRPPWVYSIGFEERYEQAELVIAGADYSDMAHLLLVLGDRIGAGERFFDGDCTTEHGLHLTFREVHSVHITGGLVNMWLAHYERQPVIPRLQVLQVCVEQEGLRQPRLDRASTTFYGVTSRHRSGGRHRR